MKLSGFRETADYYTGKVSEINRQLAFVGIAVVWIFKRIENNIIHIPDELILPLLLFTITLFFDLLHYILGSIIWSVFHRNQERKHKNEDDEVLAKVQLTYPIYLIWGLKLLTNLIGYLCLIIFIWEAMK